MPQVEHQLGKYYYLCYQKIVCVKNPVLVFDRDAHALCIEPPEYVPP